MKKTIFHKWIKKLFFHNLKCLKNMKLIGLRLND